MTTLISFVICCAMGVPFGFAVVRIWRLTEERDRLDTVAFNRLAEIVRLQRDVACLNRQLQQAREFNQVHSKGGES